MLIQWAYGGYIILPHNLETLSTDTVYIAYTKPSGDCGYWEAEYNDDNDIAYLVEKGDIDERNEWTFQGVVVRSGETIESGLRTLPFTEIVKSGVCEDLE